MKKIFLSLAVLGFGTAFAEVSSQTITQFLRDVDGKEITKSPEIIQQWEQLKAQMLEMGAKELAKHADKQPELGEVADTMAKLASQLKALPKPKEGITKSGENTAMWLEQKEKMENLKADELDSIAKQTGSNAATELANHMRKMATMLQQGLDAFKATKGKSEAKTEMPNMPNPFAEPAAEGEASA